MSEKCPTCDGRGVVPELKLCANEPCPKWFRWQEGRSKQEGAKGSRLDAQYCSRLCAKAQAQRNHRARKRAGT